MIPESDTFDGGRLSPDVTRKPNGHDVDCVCATCDPDPAPRVDGGGTYGRRIGRTVAIATLREFLDTLPAQHHERPGVVRAIEVLRDDLRPAPSGSVTR